MKKLLLSILLFLPMFALQSCDEKETPAVVTAAIAFPDSATPAPTFLTDGGTQTITFSSTQAWTAGVEADKTWCTISPANGEAGAAATMTITVAKNKTYDSRSAVVTIVSEGVEQAITVTQSQIDSFSFTGAPKDVLPATENTFVITTAENTGTPTVGALPDWITVVTAPAVKGISNTTLTFTVKENTTFDPREATITITSGTAAPESFVVKQVQNDSFTISGQPTETFGINGGTFTITTAENTGAPTVGELPEWITIATAPAAKGLTETKFTFTVKENKTNDVHSAEITVTSGDATPQSFTVTQLNLNSPIVFVEPIVKAILLKRTGTNPDEPGKLKIDTNDDKEISYNEAAIVTEIIVSSSSLKSLTDIEHFTALKKLTCYNNQLTALELSNNTQLTELNCSNNQLTALDVTKNIELTYLNCYKNQLTTIDLSKNTQLTGFFCNDNKLTTLDVSNNTQLTELKCHQNQLTTLDVTHNTALTTIGCHLNQLTAIDVSKNTKLKWLECYNNQLTALDVSNSTQLTGLICYTNQLKTLNLSSNTQLTGLICYGNKLTALDLSNNTQLTLLDCQQNKLTALDLSNNTKLTDLKCHENQLTTIDVSKNTKLKWLECYNNQLTALDLSNSTQLTGLKCDPMNDAEGNNLLTTIFLTQAQKEANDAKKFIYSPTETALTVR